METILAVIAAISSVVAIVTSYQSNKSKMRWENAQTNAVNVETFQGLVKDVGELTKKYNDLDRKYSILWQYTLALIENDKRHRIKPVPPPTELQTDPQLMKLIVVEPKEKRKVSKKK